MSKESKHVAKYREIHLPAGETLLEWGEGYIGEVMGKGDKTQNNGVLIVTDKHVVFYRKGVFGEVLQTLPLRALTSVERKSMMGHHVLELHASHDSLKFKAFGAAVMQRLYDAIQSNRPAADSPPPAAQPATDPTTMLYKLAELRDAGILSAEEYAAKKQEILSRM